MKVKLENLNFSKATPIISAAQKFIIPVPYSEAGESFVYPDGDKKGDKIVDWEGKPMEGKGIVFFNGKDASYQAVKSDGDGVIIVNLVTKEEAAKIDKKVRELLPTSDSTPENLSLDNIKSLLDYIQKELKLTDIYNSTKDFISGHMTNLSNTPICYGLHMRQARDICQALYLEGAGEFSGGPAATTQ